MVDSGNRRGPCFILGLQRTPRVTWQGTKGDGTLARLVVAGDNPRQMTPSGPAETGNPQVILRALTAIPVLLAVLFPAGSVLDWSGELYGGDER
jgi:hypothetical protein